MINFTTDLPHPYNKAGDGPEGPEVRVVSDKLKKYAGSKLENLTFTKNAKIEGIEYLEFPKRLHEITSYGKKIIFNFGNFYFIISLGMSGRLSFKKTKHSHVEINFDTFTLFFTDSRRFGSFRIVDFEGYCEIFSKIGTDFLLCSLKETIKKEDFLFCFEKTLKSSKKICDVLVDQSFVSGIGWYLMLETLFCCSIHPLTPCRDLSKENWFDIFENLKTIILESYSLGGFTLESFISPDGEIGRYRPRIYGLSKAIWKNQEYDVIREKYGNRTIQFICKK